MNLFITRLYLFVLTVSGTPLSDYILHYEPLHYKTLFVCFNRFRNISVGLHSALWASPLQDFIRLFLTVSGTSLSDYILHYEPLHYQTLFVCFSRFRNTSIGLHSTLWTSPLRQGHIPHGAPPSQTIHQTRPAPRLPRSRKVSWQLRTACISPYPSSDRSHASCRPRISHLGGDHIFARIYSKAP